MKAIRRTLCLALVAMMLCAAAVPALAATKTIYLEGKDSNYGWAWFTVGEYKKGTKITNVKSSKPSVLSLNRVEIREGENTNYENKKYSNSYVNLEVECRARKAGSAKITYKANGKAKSQAVAVKAYTNPVKSFVLTGLGNANLKSKFATDDYCSAEALKKDAPAGLLKVSAASGWKISSLYFNDGDNDIQYEFYSWGKPVSSAKLNVPAMKAGKHYYIWANFVNTKTKGEIDVTYSIREYYDEDDDYDDYED